MRQYVTSDKDFAEAVMLADYGDIIYFDEGAKVNRFFINVSAVMKGHKFPVKEEDL